MDEILKKFSPIIEQKNGGLVIRTAGTVEWAIIKSGVRIKPVLCGRDAFTGEEVNSKKLLGDQTLHSYCEKIEITNVPLFGRYELKFYADDNGGLSTEPIYERELEFQDVNARPQLNVEKRPAAGPDETEVTLSGTALRYLGDKLWIRYDGRYYRLRIPQGAAVFSFRVPTKEIIEIDSCNVLGRGSFTK